MHYKNGREAKVGDKIIGRDKWGGDIFTGIVVSATPGSDACNLLVVPILPGRAATASDCLHMEDAVEPQAVEVPIAVKDANPS